MSAEADDIFEQSARLSEDATRPFPRSRKVYVTGSRPDIPPIVGLDAAEVSASSTAALGRRDVILVQDVSGSFEDELPQARDALRDFSNAMAAQGLSGDRIGLVTFSNLSSLEQPLTEVPDELDELLAAIDAFGHCEEVPEYDCYTHIALGLDDAIAELEAA